MNSKILVIGTPAALDQSFYEKLLEMGFQISFFAQDLRETERLTEVLRHSEATAVLYDSEFHGADSETQKKHLQEDPAEAYDFHLGGILSLLKAMLASKVFHLVSLQPLETPEGGLLQQCLQMKDQMIEDARKAYGFAIHKTFHRENSASNLIQLLKNLD